jgi:hypothetical protein
LLTRVDLPVAASATYAYDAPSKFATYATCAPFGDQTGELSVAPGGVLMVRVAPVSGFISVRPRRVLVVSERARFASVSTTMPAR